MSRAFDPSQREFFGRLVSCAVKVEPDTDDGYGAGFVLNRDGYVLTARHVVTGASRAQIRFLRLRASGHALRIGGAWPAVLVADDPELDVALLRLERLPPGLTPVNLGGSSGVGPGTALWRVGLDDVPLANGYCFSCRHGDFGRSEFRACMDAGPGSSGGPIFNEDGHVVGIALLYQPDKSKPPYSVAVPIDAVKRRFLERYALRQQLTDGQPPDFFTSSE